MIESPASSSKKEKTKSVKKKPDDKAKRLASKTKLTGSASSRLEEEANSAVKKVTSRRAKETKRSKSSNSRTDIPRMPSKTSNNPPPPTDSKETPPKAHQTPSSSHQPPAQSIQMIQVQKEDEEMKRVTPLIVAEELELKECIGQGACGNVWKGMLRGTVVAVKELKSKYENAEQFKREIGIMIRIRHPNVVLFMGACHDPPYIVTEYLEAGDLLDWIGKNQKLLEKKDQKVPIKEMLQISIDIAKGMAWLHQFKPQPIIHKDLKPTNIMLDSKGNAKIIDFGLSEVQKQREMENRRFAGSASWMSPEMLLGKSYTEKIDVYAYGIILWQIFTSSTEVYDIRRYQHLSPSAAIQKFIHDIVDGNMRPDLNFENLKSNLAIRSIITQAWDSDPHYRPSFKQIIEILTNTRLSTILKDNSAIQFWQHNFPDKEVVPLEQFYDALWDTLYAKGEAPSPDRGDLLQRCIEAIIHAPGTKTDTISLERFGNLLHWYGPLQKDNINHRNILEKILDLLQKPWFHAEITGHEAEELLNTSGTGENFLIRCSLSPLAPFTISRLHVSSENQKSIVHHRINFNPQSSLYTMQYQAKSADIKLITVKSIEEFIENAKPVLGLKNPVLCTKFQSVFTSTDTKSDGRYSLAMEDL